MSNRFESFTRDIIHTLLLTEYTPGNVDVMKQFKYTYVTREVMKRFDNDLLSSQILNNYQIIGTTDYNRRPENDEIIICYGSYPITYESLLINGTDNSVVYRNVIDYSDIHDRFEGHQMWDKIDKVLMINMEDRQDRYYNTMIEFSRVHIPLDKVTRIGISSDIPHLGTSLSHLEAVKQWQGTILICEDDIMFSDTFVRELNNNKSYTSSIIDILENNNWSVILLATSKYGDIQSINNIVSRSYQRCTTCSCYIVTSNSKFREDLIDTWTTAIDGISTFDHKSNISCPFACDRSWYKLMKLYYFLTFTEKIAYQRPSISSNTGRFECYLD